MGDVRRRRPLPFGDDRYDLQERYLELTRVRLPKAARDGAWPVRDDHCFMRIVLDHLFEGCWYDHLDRRLRAYRRLNDTQLRAAVALAERMLAEGPDLVMRLNAASLAWRGIEPGRPRRGGGRGGQRWGRRRRARRRA